MTANESENEVSMEFNKLKIAVVGADPVAPAQATVHFAGIVPRPTSYRVRHA